MECNARFVLHNLIAYFGIWFSIAFIEMTLSTIPAAAFPANDQGLFYLFGFGAIFLFILYYFIDGKKNKLKPSAVLICSFIVLLVSNVVTIILQNTETFVYEGRSVTVSFSMQEKLNYILSVIVVLFVILVGYRIATKRKLSIRSFNIVYYIIMIVGIVGIIASLSLEMDKYALIFTGNFEKRSFPSIQSVFGNENIFGIILTICLGAVAINRSIKKHWWQLILYVLFAVELVFTTSLTCITGFGIFTIFYIVVAIIKKFTEKLGIALFWLSLCFIIPIGILVGLNIGKDNNVRACINVLDFFSKAIFSKDYSTFTQRIILWKEAWYVASETPLTMLFGRGYGMGINLFQHFDTIVRNVPISQSVIHTHSAFLDIILQFGLVGLSIYVMMIVYFIRSVIFIIRHHDSRLGLMFLGIFISYTLIGFWEDIHFFKVGSVGMGMCAAFILPAINYYKNHKKNGISIENEKNLIEEQKKSPHIISPFSLGLLIMLLILASINVINVEFRNNQNLLTVFIFAIEILFISILFTPYLMKIWESNHKRTILRICLFAPISLLFPGIYLLLYFLNKVSMADTLWLPAFVFFMTLLLIASVYTFVFENKKPAKNYFSIYRSLGGYSIFVYLFEIAFNLTLIFVFNSLYPSGGIALALVIMAVTFAVTFALFLIPNKYPCIKNIYWYNTLYLRYEVNLYKKENLIKWEK